jgi:hypothetical protein
MNLKKLGIVLFLCMCLAGFSLSSVNAATSTTKDIVEYNKVYIPQDFNIKFTDKYHTVAQYEWQILMNEGWFIKLESTGKSFESGANRRDKKGNLLRSNVAYIADHVGVHDQTLYDEEFSYRFIIDCRDTGIKTINLNALVSNTITGSLNKKIIDAEFKRIDASVTFNNKNFEIRIPGNFNFGRSDINKRVVPVTFTFEDKSVQTVNVKVLRK